MRSWGFNLIFSLWEGYMKKPDTKKFLQYFENRGFTIHIIHTSGHADINTLKQMVEAIAIFSYDITERKLAEYALSVSEDKSKQIAKSLLLAYTLFRMQKWSQCSVKKFYILKLELKP